MVVGSEWCEGDDIDWASDLNESLVFARDDSWSCSFEECMQSWESDDSTWTWEDMLEKLFECLVDKEGNNKFWAALVVWYWLPPLSCCRMWGDDIKGLLGEDARLWLRYCNAREWLVRPWNEFSGPPFEKYEIFDVANCFWQFRKYIP